MFLTAKICDIGEGYFTILVTYVYILSIIYQCANHTGFGKSKLIANITLEWSLKLNLTV